MENAPREKKIGMDLRADNGRTIVDAPNNAIITRYDDLMDRSRNREFYGKSDFYNYGYWFKNTQTQEEACENLMEQLLEFIPEKRGNILDVACGMGATTRYLLKYFSASNVVGINISQKQLEISRANALGCEFMLMDAVDLAFRDAFFNNIICVEAAFHFDTRERFVQEAYRVLKPGGYLVLSDISFAQLARLEEKSILPEKNFVKNIEEYRSVYLRAGFHEVKIVDATRECWGGVRRHAMRRGFRRLRKREIGIRFAGEVILVFLLLSIVVRHYLLVSARKR